MDYSNNLIFEYFTSIRMLRINLGIFEYSNFIIRIIFEYCYIRILFEYYCIRILMYSNSIV